MIVEYFFNEKRSWSSYRRQHCRRPVEELGIFETSQGVRLGVERMKYCDQCCWKLRAETWVIDTAVPMNHISLPFHQSNDLIILITH